MTRQVILTEKKVSECYSVVKSMTTVVCNTPTNFKNTKNSRCVQLKKTRLASTKTTDFHRVPRSCTDCVNTTLTLNMTLNNNPLQSLHKVNTLLTIRS